MRVRRKRPFHFFPYGLMEAVGYPVTGTGRIVWRNLAGEWCWRKWEAVGDEGHTNSKRKAFQLCESAGKRPRRMMVRRKGSGRLKSGGGIVLKRSKRGG